MESERFILIQDDDSHWYVCPAAKASEAEQYFEEVADYWNKQKRVRDCPDMPEWLREVGGCPGLVSFTNPIIG